MFELWLLDLMALFSDQYNDLTEQVYAECNFAPAHAFYHYFIWEE